MKKDSVTDWLVYILFKAAGPFFRALPLESALFLGRRLGDVFCFLDTKHKAIVYANLKIAFAHKIKPEGLARVTRDFYRHYGQNIIEIFLIPKIDGEYIRKYVSIEGLENVRRGFNKGKGVILVGVHEGSWELSNVICANLGFAFNLFILNQRFPRLNNLLNKYRSQKGCRIIGRQNQTRQLIQVLKDNQAIGITLDQGGKAGTLVKFFGKNASMATGAVRLALKYDAALIPAFYARVRGPYIKVIVGAPFELKRSSVLEDDVRTNLQELFRIYESSIERFPQEYLWSYKVWKYTDEKDVLVLSDSKAGHLRQSEATAQLLSGALKERGTKVNVHTQEIRFKNKLGRWAFTLLGFFCLKHCLWGYHKFMRLFLARDVYEALAKSKADFVVSCGFSLAALNLILCRESLAKSICLLRPSVLSVNRFDLVIMPSHDRPPQRKNVLITEGALNSVNAEYLDSCKRQAVRHYGLDGLKRPVVGLLLGGDSKNFKLETGSTRELVLGLKQAIRALDADLLATTSRRTRGEVEDLMKEELKNYPPCKLLIVANEKNTPYALGGILALSDMLIVSPESISMVSEAVSSAKYVLVFETPSLDKKHRMFLNNFSAKGYIRLCAPQNLGKVVEGLWSDKPPLKVFDDKAAVYEAIKKVL